MKTEEIEKDSNIKINGLSLLNFYGDLHRFLENGVVQDINSDRNA